MAFVVKQYEPLDPIDIRRLRCVWNNAAAASSPLLDRAISAAALAQNSLADSQFSPYNRLASRIA